MCPVLWVLPRSYDGGGLSLSSCLFGKDWLVCHPSNERGLLKKAKEKGQGQAVVAALIQTWPHSGRMAAERAAAALTQPSSWGAY